MSTICMYCYDGNPCEAKSPRGYLCTRTAGHSGEHVACDDDDHPITTWDQPLGAYTRHEKHDPANDIDRQAVAEEHEDTIRALIKERDEARATKDMHKRRADEERACAEKAEKERDEARRERDSWRAQVPLADWEKDLIQATDTPRPLTPDAITDEMLLRALIAHYGWEGRTLDEFTDSAVADMQDALTAALTEPPARPEGAERWEDFLIDSLDYQSLTDQQITDLADRIAEEMNR